MTAHEEQDVMDLYRKRARRYDISANLYYLIGFREFAYRRKAIDVLNLAYGDTVVEIGCGTGLNFSYLQEKIGPGGKLIGVDLTDKMLDRAAERVTAHAWKNVELVLADAADYVFPQKLDGVLSSFALTLSPNYERIIKNSSGALSPGKRMVVLDLKLTDWAPSFLVTLGLWITRPFGVTRELAERKPWVSMKEYFKTVEHMECYFGLAYIAVGEAQA